MYDIPKYINGTEKMELLRDLFLFHFNRELNINKTCKSIGPKAP